MNNTAHFDDIPAQASQVQKVTFLQPVEWIRMGWEDLKHHRAASIAYGFLVAGLGLVILLFTTTHIYLMAAAVSGFLLIGPIMATGLCELSRRRGLNASISFDDSLEGLGRNYRALWRFAAALLAISLIWFLFAGLLLQSLFQQSTPTLAEMAYGGVLENLTILQLVFYISAGGVLAFLVFALSVVSVPAIIDQTTLTAGEAMKLSIRVVAANIPAMVMWAALIVGLTAIGFLTVLLGLIIIYPLLGHATWYAYRDLVR
ncbi:MAG: DUF2189 domain-containing protein [Gammaproteobacteria bacterium]